MEWNVFFGPEGISYDCVVDLKKCGRISEELNRFETIQVKAAWPRKLSTRSGLYYEFGNSSGDLRKYDCVLAFVALDLKKIKFDLPANLSNSRLTLPRTHFRHDITEMTWRGIVMPTWGLINVATAA